MMEIHISEQFIGLGVFSGDGTLAVYDPRTRKMISQSSNMEDGQTCIALIKVNIIPPAFFFHWILL
jgi:hypothetical protein